MWRLTCCTGAGQVESNLSLFFCDFDQLIYLRYVRLSV